MLFVQLPFNSMQLSVFTDFNVLQSRGKAGAWKKFISAVCRYNTIPVIMATRSHLFPFRTQKLSSSTAKVLDHPRSGRIASCRISKKTQSQLCCGCVLFLQLAIRQWRTRATVHRTVDTHCPWSPRWASASGSASGDRNRRFPCGGWESKLQRGVFLQFAIRQWRTSRDFSK